MSDLDPAGLEAAAKALCPVPWKPNDAPLVRTYTAQATAAVRAYLAAAQTLTENPACPYFEGEGHNDLHGAWHEGFAAGRAAATPDPPTRTVHKCPSCNRYFDSPSVCSDGTHTVEQEERIPQVAPTVKQVSERLRAERMQVIAATPGATHPTMWRGDPSAASPDERLREAAEAAVFACLPVLPITGSQNRGYKVSDAIDPKVIADPQEWVDAAHAICELHRLAAADREKPDEPKEKP